MTTDWKPRTFEDSLIHKYWQKYNGRIYLEVPIGGNGGRGNWLAGSKIRRIDAVRVPDAAEEEHAILPFKEYTEDDFFSYSQDKTIELIEVKTNLNRLIIGQIIAGIDMFERQYAASRIIPIILCIEGDPALEWVCEKRGIHVKIAEPSF